MEKLFKNINSIINFFKEKNYDELSKYLASIYNSPFIFENEEISENHKYIYNYTCENYDIIYKFIIFHKDRENHKNNKTTGKYNLTVVYDFFENNDITENIKSEYDFGLNNDLYDDFLYSQIKINLDDNFNILSINNENITGYDEFLGNIYLWIDYIYENSTLKNCKVAVGTDSTILEDHVINIEDYTDLRKYLYDKINQNIPKKILQNIS